MKRYISASAVLAGLSLFPLEMGHAQILYGSLVGNVKDSTDAAVPSATVKATNIGTGQFREALTNDVGAYSIPNLLPGTYEVSISKEGFRARKQSGIQVTINTVTRADATLEVGAVSESVTVQADTAALQTDRAEVRAEVTAAMLQNIPVPVGRNYQGLFITIPGFSPPRNAHSIPANPSRALMFNVNGTSASSNNTRIDGASSTNVWLPHIVAYVPALESIENVNVVTNSFDAEQGLAGGAAINVQIKSGTNDVHGSAFEYYNGNATKAKPFFLPQGERNPKWVFNQYGGTVGGPFIKNKLFYFGSYEATRDHRFASAIASIPTPAMRTGDLSAAPADRPIFDPLTGGDRGLGRLPFAGNLIPAARFSPVVRKLLPLFPTPTSPGSQNNYFVAQNFSFDRHTLDTKVNWNPSTKLTMYGRYSWLDYTTRNPYFFGNDLGGPPIAGGQPGVASGNSYSTTIAATYIFSPTFLVDANFGYTRMQGASLQPRLNEKVGLDVLGIPGTNGPRFFEGGWPQLTISSFTGLGHSNNFMPYINRDPQYQYVANGNWSKGKHGVRFGLDFYQQHLNQTQPEFIGGGSFAASGGFAFGPGQTSQGAPPGQAAPRTSEFNSFASFLLGATNSHGRLLMVPDEFTTRTNLYSTYIRDQWQATRNLTLSYGVRWEYFPIPGRRDRGLERYDFATNKMLLCGTQNIPRDCGIKESKARFAPRFGAAYRASNTFVVRAGYGLTNDPYNLGRPLRTNHPLLISLVINSPDGGFAPSGFIDRGIPAITPPDLSTGIVDVPSQVVVNTLMDGPNWSRGYIQSWNVALQKQLRGGWLAEAAYVATRAINQLGFLDRNVGDVGGGEQSRPLFQRFGRLARTAQVTGLGTYTYDSLQTRLERRFANGVQLQIAYTFSKNMGIAGNVNSDGSPLIHLPAYYHLNRAVTDLNSPHNFQLNSFAELPFGRGKRLATSGWANHLLGGWQVNTLLSMYTGTPFSVTSPGTTLRAPGNAQRADLVKPTVQKIGGVGPGQVFFDRSSFAEVREVRFGTAGWNILQGPGTINLDLGLFRRFVINERFTLQFRAESFNSTNTPHFSNPIGDVASTRFMEVGGVRGTGREGVDERVFRFGLRLAF